MLHWRFRKIDKTNRRNHFHLDDDDICYYFLEYTRGVGYQGSEENSFILNFQISVTEKNTRRYYYKKRAIEEGARNLEHILHDGLDQMILVPTPPSKNRENPKYDDRILALLKRIQVLAAENGVETEVVEAVEQTISRKRARDSEERPSPKQLEQIYRVINSGEISEKPDKYIIIVDDVLVAGAHFKAMQNVLAKACNRPKNQIGGLFLARRIFDPKVAFGMA